MKKIFNYQNTKTVDSAGSKKVRTFYIVCKLPEPLYMVYILPTEKKGLYSDQTGVKCRVRGDRFNLAFINVSNKFTLKYRVI